LVDVRPQESQVKDFFAMTGVHRCPLSVVTRPQVLQVKICPPVFCVAVLFVVLFFVAFPVVFFAVFLVAFAIRYLLS